MPLPTMDQLYEQALAGIRGYGNSERTGLQQTYRNAMGSAMQGLASSGLAGTTIAPSMRMGYMKQYQQALNQLGQQVNQANLGAQQTFGMGGLSLQQQQQQMANQMELGRGNLDVARQHANIAQGQLGVQQGSLGLQQQQQGWQQGYQNQLLAQSRQQEANQYSPFNQPQMQSYLMANRIQNGWYV